MLGYAAPALAGLLALTAGLLVLLGNTSWPAVRLLSILPGADLAVGLTPLSAAFWVVAGLPIMAVSIYAMGYARHIIAQGGPRVAVLGTCFNLFVGSLLLVLAATSALGFLVAWEAMALFSYLLVVFDYRDRAVVRAGLLYAMMTHAGTVCIILCFVLLASHAPGGALTFDALTVAGHHLAPEGPAWSSCWPWWALAPRQG